MCDVNGPFKLCTCETNVDKTKPHWILHRHIQSKEEFPMLLDSMKDSNSYVKYTMRNLRKRLNTQNAFNFEYIPQEGDYLELFLAPEVSHNEISPDYYLEYKKGKWTFLNKYLYTQYTHSESQSGIIESVTTDLTNSYNFFIENASENQIQEFEFDLHFYLFPQKYITKKGLIEFFTNSTKK